MINLASNQAMAGFLRRTLQRFGLPTDFGECIALLAKDIRDHKHLENLLTSMSGEERQMFYDSVRPHLRFEAKPLDAYISSVSQRAEREQWPTQDAQGKLHPFKPAFDEATLSKMVAADIAKSTLTLTCAKCTKQESFHRVGEETPVQVIMKARRAGWIYDYLSNPGREICPTCPTSLRANA